MPQGKQEPKFTTRDKAGIYDQKLVPMDKDVPKVGGNYRYTAGDTKTLQGDKARGIVNPSKDKMDGDIKSIGVKRNPASMTQSEKNGISVDNKVVNVRDASNAKTARTRLAGRAAAAAVKPSTSFAQKVGKTAGNPMVAAATAIAEADKATGYKRVKYSGSFGGPSFSSNPYAKTNTSSKAAPSMRSMLGMPKGK